MPTSNSVFPAPIALAPSPNTDGSKSQLAFNDSPFKWHKYRLGVESFDCIGIYDASTIAAFKIFSEETLLMTVYAKLCMFTILLALNIALPFTIPLNPVEQGADVNLFFLELFTILQFYAAVWYAAHVHFPVHPKKLHRNVVKLTLMTTCIRILPLQIMSFFIWPVPMGKRSAFLVFYF